MHTITMPVDSIAPIWAACQGLVLGHLLILTGKLGKDSSLSLSHFYMVLTSLHHPYVFNHQSRCPLREVHHENREMMHLAWDLTQ